MITSMIDKKLGILPRKKTLYKKRPKKTKKITEPKEIEEFKRPKVIKLQREIRLKSEPEERTENNDTIEGKNVILDTYQNNLVEIGDLHEEKYLNPEYQHDHLDVGHRLKVQKLVVEKHARDRRSTIMQLPFIKDKVFI